jgi:hypothetical protein
VNGVFRFCSALLAFGVILFGSEALLACAVCFGDPNSDMVKGANAGILILLGVVVTVLGAIVGVTLFWIRRARLLKRVTPEEMASL